MEQITVKNDFLTWLDSLSISDYKQKITQIRKECYATRSQVNHWKSSASKPTVMAQVKINEIANMEIFKISLT